MSRIIVDAIRNSSASSDGITLSSDGKVTFPNTSTGKLLQVVQATKTDGASQAVSSGGYWQPTAPKCSITPSNASNKILVQATIAAALSQDAHGMYLTVLKDGNPIFRGDQDSSNMQRVTTGTYSHNDYNFGHLNFNYLDTAGGTSAIELSLIHI